MNVSKGKAAAEAAAVQERTDAYPSPVTDEYTTKARILQLLKEVEGDPNGISRIELWRRTAYNDREIRRAISALRADFLPIGIGPNGGYTYGNADGIKRAIADYHRKAVRSYKLQFALEQAYAGMMNECFPIMDDLKALEEGAE